MSIDIPFSSVAELFCITLKRYPNKPALVFNNQSWSYGKLSSAISSVINRLKQHINANNSRIAIIGNNHLSYVIAYFAAQFLGASTVEVDRNESLDTLISIIITTGACFVVTDREDLKTSLESQIRIESFQEFLSSCETFNNDFTKFPEVSNSLHFTKEASIVYTSGTTGSAKGVILSQENFCFIAYIVADYLKLNHKDRYALILPLCHTYGKSVLLSSFVVGATLVMLNNFNRLANFINQLSKEKCSVLSAVPYHIHVLLKGGFLSKHDLSSLRAITSSSNKLAPATIDNLFALLPKIQIYSMYGLTESTTRACYVPPDLLQSKKDSCGKPLPGIELMIIGKDGSKKPTGHVGEILLRGPNIMKGYFDDFKLTSKTLVSGWLKTGDLGHLDEDGFLYLDGRKKDLIKCAGERINPLEIEHVIMEHTGVEEAAVIGHPDSLMGEIIHAYVVPRDLSLRKAELRKHCFHKLTHNKVPYHYTFVDQLPKTATGKVKKYLLS